MTGRGCTKGNRTNDTTSAQMLNPYQIFNCFSEALDVIRMLQIFDKKNSLAKMDHKRPKPKYTEYHSMKGEAETRH